MATWEYSKLMSFAIIAILVTSVYAAAAAPTPAFAVHTRTCDAPDFFGYICIDSNQAGGPAFSYIDISATGIPILSEVDDSFVSGIPIGFDFSFYGTTYTTLAISSNGLTLTGTPTAQFNNEPIGASTPSNFIAPFWDDLVTFGPGIIYYETQGAAPNRIFIVQWHDVQGFSSSPSGARFQAVLKEGSSEILFQYLDVDFGNTRTNGADATVGIESPSGAGSQYSFNEASLSNGLSILFTPMPVAVDDSTITDEDTQVTTDVLANDYGLGDTPISVAIETPPANGAATANLDNTITYLPAADFNGADSYSYRVTDVNGDTDTATVTVTINAINDEPVADDDSYDVNEDTTLNVPAPGVLDGDTDADSPTLDANLVSGTTQGTLTLNSDGSFEYAPDSNYNGADSFTYQANDGTLDSNVATVLINVISVNDTPTGTASLLTVPEDVPTVGSMSVSDVDGDALTVTVETQGAKGTVSIQDNTSYLYTPNLDANGPDSFQMRVSDGTADSFFDVFVEITPVNDLPTANAGPDQSADEGTAVALAGSGSDVDGDALTFSWAQTAGTPVVLSDASVAGPTFTAPSVGLAGETLTFEITVSDGSGDNATDSVSIQVNNVDLTPPEAYNQFDPVTKGVLVFGVDDADGDMGPITPSSVTKVKWRTSYDDEGSRGYDDDNDDEHDGKYDKRNSHTSHKNAELRTYTITDSSGNTLVLTEVVKTKGKEIKVKVISIKYGDEPEIKPKLATKNFEWSLNKNGSIKELEQEMTVGKGKAKQEVDADYDSKKNKTTIESKNPKSKETLPGLVLLKMSTSDGSLVISH